MTIILLFSVATASACYIATTTQARADSAMNISCFAREIAQQFEIVKQQCSLDSANFKEQFNNRMEFVLNCLAVDSSGESTGDDSKTYSPTLAVSETTEGDVTTYVWVYSAGSKSIKTTVGVSSVTNEGTTVYGYTLSVVGAYGGKEIVSLSA